MSKWFVGLIGCLVLFALFVSAAGIETVKVPVFTALGYQVGYITAEGVLPETYCVLVSGDLWRDAILSRTGRDVYATSVKFGVAKPYGLFCGTGSRLVGVGLSGGTCLNG